MFIGKYNKSVILTYMGAVISIIGMYFAIKKDFDLTMICMIVAGICDLFDGKVANMCKRNEEEKAFGVQIDSLVDVVSFLVFPTIFLYSFDSRFLIVGAAFILAGIIRLAYFNVHKEEMGVYFKGLPVTYIALIIPLYYLIAKFMTVLNGYYAIVYILVGLAYILKVNVKKPTGLWYGFFTLLAIAVIVGLVVL